MKDDKRLKRKVRNSYIVSTVSIMLVLFLLGSVGYLMVAAMKVAQTLQESIAVTVELQNGISDQQRETINKRLTAEDGQPADIGFVELGENLVRRRLREGLAVVEVPRLRLEAAGTAVAAAGDEERHPHADAVGDVAFFQFSVVHGMTSFRFEGVQADWRVLPPAGTFSRAGKVPKSAPKPRF